MSHYPTSAELHQLRREIDNIGAFRHPCESCGVRPDGTPEIAGAWPEEKRRGIGYRLSARGNLIYSAYDRGQDARRGASAMRSRAYSAPLGKDACLALWASAQRYAPGTHPMSDTDRFWDDEQPRPPLPIAYRNPLVRV